MRHTGRRKLARLILCALLAGGAAWMPSSASAEVTVTDANDARLDSTFATALGVSNGGRLWYLKSGYGTSLKIKDGNFSNNNYAAWRLMSDGEVTGYTLTVDSGSFNGMNIFAGGWSDTGTANGNRVYVNGADGLDLKFYGGRGAKGASNNTVTIKGGNVAKVYGGDSLSGDANYNTVNLYDYETLPGPLPIVVYGGQSQLGNAMYNTINIFSTMSLGLVYGGFQDYPSGTKDVFTGNTLNIAAKDVTAYAIQNVQKLNFYLPSGIKANDTMLTVTGGATTLTGVTIGAAALTGVNLSKGDTVNLIVNANGLTTDDTTDMTNAGSAALGTASFLAPNNLTTDKKYTLGISKKDANTIIATVSDIQEEQNEERTQEAKSLVETRAATTTFVNAGADMLASQGFAQAANAVALEAAESGKTNAQGVPVASSFTPFSAFGGSSMRAESGSYVDTKGFGLNVGFAKEFSNAQGKLLFGPVVEYGGGSYDSYLDDGTHGEGNSHYFGVGVMARQVNHDGFYYEGSLRGGRVTSDYKGDLDGVGRVNYDSASNYFAAHLGVGKAFEIGNDNTLDGYFKYFYSHQAGDTATIHIEGLDDETGEFGAVDSHRIRLGARLTHTINEKNKLYGGLAYQYEFGGDARATFNGTSAPSPSVKGSSGMLELGWQVKPGEGPLTLDLGVNGWAGKQRGGSIQLGATWSF